MLSIIKTEKEIMLDIAEKEKKIRKQLKITQEQLAKKSGVSLGSLKRFEKSGEISLKNLLKIAFILDKQTDFDNIFEVLPEDYENINDLLKAKRHDK